jgi:regulatory protein
VSKDEALAKLQQFCVYQDRCHSEVKNKLIELRIYGEDLEDIIATLIEENFLNEERFAQSYARGKFRIKQWGRIKILQGLKFKKISPYCIKKGMAEINEDEYRETLKSLLLKYQSTRKFKNKYDLQNKLYAHGLSKGYEGHLISEVLATMK